MYKLRNINTYIHRLPYYINTHVYNRNNRIPSQETHE